MESVSTEYLVSIFIYMMLNMLYSAISLVNILWLKSRLSSLGKMQSQADEGLVFWKLGDNYIWTSPEDFENIRLTERSE